MPSKKQIKCNIKHTGLVCRSTTGGAKLSREEALKAGADLFWPEKPCLHGHMSYRYIIGGCCRTCVQGRNNDRRSERVADENAVDLRRALEDRPRKPKDEYDYDL